MQNSLNAKDGVVLDPRFIICESHSMQLHLLPRKHAQDRVRVAFIAVGLWMSRFLQEDTYSAMLRLVFGSQPQRVFTP